jgi:hypothetical protein
MQKQTPRLAQCNDTKYHHPHGKQLKFVGVTSHLGVLYFLTAPKVTPRNR